MPPPQDTPTQPQSASGRPGRSLWREFGRLLLVGGVLAASLWQMRVLANAVETLVQRMRRIAVDKEVQSIDVSTARSSLCRSPTL